MERFKLPAVIVAFIALLLYISKQSIDLHKLEATNAQLELKNDTLFKNYNEALESASAYQDTANQLSNALENDMNLIKDKSYIIKILKNKRNEEHSFIDGLTADSVAFKLSDYLDRKSQNDSGH